MAIIDVNLDDVGKALDAAILERGERMLGHFRFRHLPEALQKDSAPFAQLALHLVETKPANPERTVALRKLLEAKDCAVRAALPQ